MKLRAPRFLVQRFKKLVARTSHGGETEDSTSVPVEEPEEFLSLVSGIVHVGANLGQERDVYAQAGLPVIWIEPIPEIFSTLKNNLAGYPDQEAYEYLITDQDDREYIFHVANNQGASSSIFDFNLHKGIWPEVDYTKDIRLHSCTLDSFFRRNEIDVKPHHALVMDTQGSELLVLKGATSFLEKCDFIQTEVADFESYSEACQLDDLAHFLAQHGFEEHSRVQFAEHENGGCYYDVVYRRLGL